MKLTVTYFGELLEISMTPAATRMLEQERGPLFIDARLYFGCLPKKEVVFDEPFETEAGHQINSKLIIRYQSFIRGSCKVDGDAETFRPTPKKMGALRWLNIDYRNGEWLGSFGFDKKEDPEELNLNLGFASHPAG